MLDSNSSRPVGRQLSRADFLPTADLATLQRRAALMTVVRQFFTSRGYFEVETPVLSHDVVVDAHLEPFVVNDNLYLQTSPEFGMKRLLTAGAQAIFQVTRAFRKEESGQYHNPEFTMIEWYRVGDTHIEQMSFVEDLVATVFRESRRWREMQIQTPFARYTYDEAFERFAGTRVLSLETSTLAELAQRRQIAIPESMHADDRDGWLNLLLAELVEPHLSKGGPTFLFDYPASQSALARIRNDVPPVAERFELYIAGIEICNGYHELTDADELRRRMRVQAQIRAAAGSPALPDDNHLLAAMERGLPDCAGVALGFDRLAMLALDASSLDEVIAFPFERA